MAKFKYSVGDVFGSWTLLGYSGRGQWLARCVCGTEHKCFITHLAKGKSTRCRACYAAIQVVSGEFTRHSDPRSYRSWSKMRGRCFNENDDRYADYGGRGVTVCDRWRDSFADFMADMGPRPAGTSLDRIDVNGDYEPSNCRWATPKEQMRNRRMHANKPCVTELAERGEIPYIVLRTRLTRGWSLDRATKEPVHQKKDSLSALARAAGLKPGTVMTRVVRGWSLERALATPATSKCG